MHQIWAADFTYHTRLAVLDWIMSAFGFTFSASIAVAPRPLAHAPPPARPATASASPRPRADGHRSASRIKAMVRGGPGRGAPVVGSAELELAASLQRSAGVCITSRCGDFGNKMPTEIRHAEWLQRVVCGPSRSVWPVTPLHQESGHLPPEAAISDTPPISALPLVAQSAEVYRRP